MPRGALRRSPRELFPSGQRLVVHLAFLVEIERAGGVNLDVLHAIFCEFTHGGAHLIRAVGFDVLFGRRGQDRERLVAR